MRARLACRLLPLLPAGLVAACAVVGLDPRIDGESRTRFDERWHSIRMADGDVAILRAAIDPAADPGKVTVPLAAGGKADMTLSMAGWQGCKSIDMVARFTDTAKHPVDAHLFGLLCPPQPISALGHWHLARLQVLAPLPPPPALPPAHQDDGNGLGTIIAKPAPVKPPVAKP